MKTDWVEKALGDVCEIYQPEMLAKKSLPPAGDFPVFGANGQIGWFDRFNHEHSEVVLGCRGSCGSINVTPPRTWITSNAMVIRPRPATITKALLRYLLMQVDLAAVTTGVAQPQITRASLSPVTIRYPIHLSEQQRIVARLDEAFGELANLATIAGRYKAAAAELFRTRVHELLELQDGWKMRALGEVCTLQRGFDLPVQDRKPGSAPLISSSGPIAFQAASPIRAPGVVTGRSGSIGKVFWVTDDFWPLNTTLYVKEFHGNDPRFVFRLLQKFDLARYAGGAGVPTLNRNSVHSEKVSIPPSVTEQKRVAAQIDLLEEERDQMCALAENKLALVAELKQSLLARAFSGELTREQIAA